MFKLALQKSQAIPTLLLTLYAGGFALFITFNTFFSIKSPRDAVVALAIIPLPYHFYQLLRLALYKQTLIVKHLNEEEKMIYAFSLPRFFSQKDPAFALTLLLTTLALSLAFLRSTGVITPNLGGI